jgi:formylglycine-generating enzyme required for sulfatase activity
MRRWDKIMSQVFISYSRVDRDFVDDFVPFLRRVYGNDAVWFDEEIHGGSHWWNLILIEINKASVFIYLLTNESVQSNYCQAECREAIRLQKQILPILARPRTDLNLLPDDLKEILDEIHYVDLTKSVKDNVAMSQVYAALNRLLQLVPASEPTTSTPIPEPIIEDKTKTITSTPIAYPKQKWRWVIGSVALLPVVTFAIILSGVLSDKDDNTSRPTLTPSNSAIAQEFTPTGEIPPTSTEKVKISPTTAETNSPTQTSPPSQTDTPTNVLTTDTPTIDIIPATQTQEVIEVILELAQTPVTKNADWEPYIQIFDGVEMVLVPAGCFNMGNDPDAYYWDSSANLYRQGVPDGGKICFDKPFWIDRYEVTNFQFNEFYGRAEKESNWKASNLPRERINWLEAYAFCEEKRNARLPTEAEWEYSARGPGNLLFPWGNNFVADNVVYGENSGGKTASVGSKPGGVSWVGAYDLSGNVWEWVTTIYQVYPYDSEDGREKLDKNEGVPHGLRGGAWNFPNTYMHSAHRFRYYSELESYVFGFRCARDF